VRALGESVLKDITREFHRVILRFDPAAGLGWDAWWRIAAGVPVYRLDVHPSFRDSAQPMALRVAARLRGERWYSGAGNADILQNLRNVAGLQLGVGQRGLGPNARVIRLNCSLSGLFSGIRAVLRIAQGAVGAGIDRLCQSLGVDRYLLQQLATLALVLLLLLLYASKLGRFQDDPQSIAEQGSTNGR